jgi:cysteine desulfurase
MTRRIYLDYNASTPLDPRVLRTIYHTLEEEQGNPSSTHFFGRQSHRLLEESRTKIADCLHVLPQEIIFTSGGTEGAALTLYGALQGDYRGHIITSVAEHSCVYQTLQDIQKRGCEVTYLETGLWGAIQPEAVQAAIKSNTRFITCMAVNNETGVKTDISAIAKIAQEAGIPLIVDGVCLLGKEEWTVPQGVSAMFFSAHKFYASKGVGFVVCRRSLKLKPQLLGGPQEFSYRAGTENLSGIVGMAHGVELIYQEQATIAKHMQALRDYLEHSLINTISEVIVNGLGPRTTNTTNLSFLHVDGEALLMALDLEGIAVSHGSACASGALEPSRILLKMGVPHPQARTSIRFSIGRFTTKEEIDDVIEVLCHLVKKLRIN